MNLRKTILEREGDKYKIAETGTQRCLVNFIKNWSRFLSQELK